MINKGNAPTPFSKFGSNYVSQGGEGKKFFSNLKSFQQRQQSWVVTYGGECRPITTLAQSLRPIGSLQHHFGKNPQTKFRMPPEISAKFRMPPEISADRRKSLSEILERHYVRDKLPIRFIGLLVCPSVSPRLGYLSGKCLLSLFLQKK